MFRVSVIVGGDNCGAEITDWKLRYLLSANECCFEWIIGLTIWRLILLVFVVGKKLFMNISPIFQPFGKCYEKEHFPHGQVCSYIFTIYKVLSKLLLVYMACKHICWVRLGPVRPATCIWYFFNRNVKYWEGVLIAATGILKKTFSLQLRLTRWRIMFLN